MQEAQILGVCLPSFNSEVFTQLKSPKLHYLVYWDALLSSAQDKLHHLTPKNESLTGIA